ncbi:GNAT family N-acetyltransferase [Paractinoplanes lichenicola]|uniref:GNAT family N-acetyltransferase n=1 Tax=Paractinoplanes lichenicola TaxID=2802976 RepID=A0ABS1VYJ3_9ACTN|nr:GNAT family N-acetyltransferase [Actinoplanes lichenicola]MBL7259565.1 GNAT family N-acetyltransferase [Actinoplanes lichenicola]
MSDVDLIEPLWRQLHLHHRAAAAHLEEFGAARTPDESWRLRRAQYLEWQRDPRTALLIARYEDRPIGYAMVRVVHAPGSWQWGDDVGVLETLVVDEKGRGTGVGRELLRAAREHLAGLGVTVMRISVLAGNDDAVRFYRREGAAEFVRTLVMPVRDTSPAPGRPAGAGPERSPGR